MLPALIPDSRDTDGDARRQPGVMLLHCQENGTSLHWGTRDQPCPLVGWHVSPPLPQRTSSSAPMAEWQWRGSSWPYSCTTGAFSKGHCEVQVFLLPDEETQPSGWCNGIRGAPASQGHIARGGR